MTLGEKKRRAREERQLSCLELARLIHTSEKQIWYYEENILTPDVPMQEKLANSLEISLYYLRNEGCPNTRTLYFVQEAMMLLYRKGGLPALQKYEDELRAWI